MAKKYTKATIPKGPRIKRPPGITIQQKRVPSYDELLAAYFKTFTWRKAKLNNYETIKKVVKHG